MSRLSRKINLSPKTWLSLVLTVLLFGAIAVTQFATQNVRDDRSQAATCASGQNQLTFRPSGDVSTGFWGRDVNNGGFYTKVDEAPSDEDSSYVWDDTAGSGSVLVLGHPYASLAANNAINNVTISARVRQLQASQISSGPFIEVGLQVNGTLYFAPSKFHPPPNNTYDTTQNTWSTNPATGGAWTLASLNAANIAVRSTRPSQPNAIRLTQVWMDSCYSSIPAPTMAMSASATTIPYNSSVTINWSSTNATSCNIVFANTSWLGLASSGSRAVTLTSKTTFTGMCAGPGGGSNSAGVIVNVSAAPPSNPPGGGTNPPPSNPPSTPPSGGSTKPATKVTPPNSGQQPTVGINDIKLTFAQNSFLQGQMTLSLLVDGTGLAQTASIGKDGGVFVLKTGSLLAKNTNYTLTISSKNSLVQKIGFRYVDNTAVNVGTFATGDFNSDNSIDDKDLTLFSPAGIKSSDNLYDVNYDGVVNSVDYSLLLINLGKKGN